MTSNDQYPARSALSTGLRGRCPRCGHGHLFNGYLTLAPKCESCDLDYGFIDAGDGPIVFIILFAGIVLAIAALVVQVSFHPPAWVHAVLWLPSSIALPLALLRPFKGLFVALQYVNKAREGLH